MLRESKAFNPKGDHEPATFTILNFPVSDIEEAVDTLAGQGVGFERYEGTELETAPTRAQTGFVSTSVSFERSLPLPSIALI